MQNRPFLAGARGSLWRVERTEHYGRAPRTDLVYLSRAGGERPGSLIAVRPHEPLARVTEVHRIQAVSPREALRVVTASAGAARHPFRLCAATGLRGDIHAWQLAPALALARGHARVLVADEAGMGKTVAAAIAIGERLREAPDRRCLVIAPGHLLGQWQSELAGRMSIDAVCIDASSLLGMQQEIPAGMTPWMLSGCLITSLDFVKQPHVVRSLDALAWDLVAIDEAHLACGVTERHDAVSLVARRARQLLLLTATPSDGGDERLRALTAIGASPGTESLVWLRHSAAGRPRVERTLHLKPDRAVTALHAAVSDYARWLLSSPSPAEPMALLASVLVKRAHSSPYAIWLSLGRRLARLAGTAGSTQGSLFDDEDDGGVIGAPSGLPVDRERATLETLIALAAAADRHDGRLGALGRMFARAGETAVIFSCFRDTAARIAGALAAHARVGLIHGALPRAAIDAALADFAGGRAGALVATDVAAQGLNLHQRCRWVIHYDLPWRPPTLRQRIGRVDRLGQRRRVHSTIVADRTPLSLDLRRRLDAFGVRMHGHERDGGRRWDVLAAREAKRLRAFRERAASTDAPRPGAPITAFEIVLANARDETVVRDTLILQGDPEAAGRAAALAAQRTRARLQRPLTRRASRLASRERAIHAAIDASLASAPRQHGLFDRRAARAFDASASARAVIATALNDRLAEYEQESTIATTSAHVIASFT